MPYKRGLAYVFHYWVTGVLLSLAAASAATAANDPFQRYITFHNQLPITVYPLISANAKDNCLNISEQKRIIVNYQTKGAGVPPGKTVKVRIPKSPACWYNAARVYVFSVDLGEYENRMNPNERTVSDGIVWNPPLCDNSACWTGNAVTQYQPDSPAQLVEYTVISMNPATGIPFPNANNPGGIPMVDLDLSFVDSIYLPVAMALDDGGATRYMGTTLPYAQFNRRTQSFVNRKIGQNMLWSQYAAYSPVNWPNNLFHDLGSERTNHIEGGFNLVQNVLTKALSPLYTPTSTGPAQCSATPACARLVGNCCPANDGKFLDCCNTQPFLIDNTIRNGDVVSNASVNAFVGRWTRWVNADPCADLGKIPSWPSNEPSFDKQKFCDTFRTTVRFVWDYFKDFPDCVHLPRAERNRCTVDNIIGFLPNDPKNGRLNQSVQAIQRSVPWGNPARREPQYSFDKFLLFWAPYNSIFNLNPYTRFVHNKTDGLDAPGAYSFSIDDRFGNYQDRASGFIVDVGGSALLPNKEPFDPYQLYRVGYAGGWDHAIACGRHVDIPNQEGGAASLSFWQNGVHQQFCDVTFFEDAAEEHYATWRIGERTRTVTDTYTGLQHEVPELTFNRLYCERNSSPDLVAKNVCTNSNISATLSGEEAYVSVRNAQKPKVTLTVPQLP